MLLCPTKLCIKEGSQGWSPWCTCYMIEFDMVILLKHWSWGLDFLFSSCLLYNYEEWNIFFHDFGTWCLSFCTSVWNFSWLTVFEEILVDELYPINFQVLGIHPNWWSRPISEPPWQAFIFARLHQKLNGTLPLTNGPCSVRCDRAIRYSG